MAEIDITQDRRCRGRPQVRPDDETRRIIYEAARHEFAGGGYAATSIETVARRAGVSTKTLYRLIPNKAALFEGMVSDRIDRLVRPAHGHARLAAPRLQIDGAPFRLHRGIEGGRSQALVLKLRLEACGDRGCPGAC